MAGVVAAAMALTFAGCAAAGGEDHLAKGNRFLADGKLEDAQAEFRIAARRSSEPPEELLWKLGLLDLDAKNLYAAREELGQLVERDDAWRPRVARAYLLFATRWFKAGDPFSAIQAVEAVRAVEPTRNLGPVHYELGDHYFQLPDYERAAASYLQALAFAPGLEVEALHRLGLALERMGRWRQAVRYYREYVDAGGEHADSRELRYRLGEAAFRAAQESFLNHRYGEAVEYLQVMIQAGQPETRLDDAYHLLGEVRFRTGDLGAAEAAFVRVLELSPSSSSRLYGEAERRLLDIRIGGAPGGGAS